MRHLASKLRKELQRAARAYFENPCPTSLTQLKIAALEQAAGDLQREARRYVNKLWMREHRARAA